ncbi:hypothetical protein ACFSQ7_38470 [Paenibacillus rhizoplanae]
MNSWSCRKKLAHLLPLAENELTLMLMLEHVQDLEPEQLAGLLELHFSKGYAMVLSFPRHGGDGLGDVPAVQAGDL